MTTTPERAATAPSLRDRMTLAGILTGGWLAQGCYAVAELGLPDLLADGPRPAAELAAETDADPRAVRRLLRVLSSVGLFTEPEPGVFALAPTGRLLCTDTVRSSRSAAIMFGEEVHRSFGAITHTLRTGTPAFDSLYGMPFYDYLDSHPEAAAVFTSAMGAAPVPPALNAVDLTGVGTLVDVGGGDGSLLAKVLPHHPVMRGVLTELPDALEGARDRLTLLGLADRTDLVAGSFFDPLPEGGDVYTLSRVLHNWNDDKAVRILRRVREAMPDHGRLLVLERLETPVPEGAALTRQAAQGRLIDLLMLVMLEGWDRSEEEYRALLEAAGFTVRAVHPAPLQSDRAEQVIEAVPAGTPTGETR
ncbi:methyltransferase [Streptomyces sp. MBT62]|uniref:methyltransferase n=1 Tax=Streptomyces sp. MBT62 TaxID=2800410 RepID=UPI0019097F4F|nr:methyltransferase [Streptomyces sp. MBT62]MBK3570865.1 methyltransferase [Streptomyces sp. MBT62]